MKKSTRILFTVTAVISFIISFVFFLQAIGLMFNIGGFKDLYIEMIQKIGIATEPNELSFEVYMGIFDALVGILLNSYAAGIYLKLSKAKTIILGTNKVVLYVGILQCFFIVSILPGLLGIIASRIIKKQETAIVNRPRDVVENRTNDIVDRITNLKARKDAGLITQEEYDRRLNEIIEQSAKYDAMHGVVPKSNETLQDKIHEIKSQQTENVEKSEDNKKDND